MFTSVMAAKINYIFSDKQKNVRKNCVLISKYHKRGMLYLEFEGKLVAFMFFKCHY
jgi:hypothetical protein